MPKPGNLISPGFVYNGKLSCSRISFPPEIYESDEFRTELNLPGPLAERDPLGYKSSFGRVMIIGGGRCYYGAPALAASAAYRSGAGYLSAAVPSSHASVFSGHCPEAVLLPLRENGRGAVARSNRELILDALSRQDCVLLGPGLSDDPETRELIRELIPLISLPLVIDADALGALAGHPELTRQREALTVITPHRGEQRRLLAGMTGETPLEELYNAVCVYKGPRSRIAFPDGRQFINPSGSAALGTAGSGDVLAGMISGMIPWENSPEDAVRKAVLLHGLTGQSFSGAEESLCAGDLIRELPSLFRRYREEYDQLSSNCFGILEMIP
jgi:NAD(P)H-hydrate epimerase